MKNIFSASETTPEHESFAGQQQPGTQPTAPSTNPQLPARAPVELSPIVEAVAEVAGSQTDWESTPIA